jgi:hypothetical protein
MTEEEGVEEKRDERDIRQVAGNAGVDFRLWLDEKFFIDEYGHHEPYPLRTFIDPVSVAMYHLTNPPIYQMCSRVTGSQSNH